jgi:hypothetical protein
VELTAAEQAALEAARARDAVLPRERRRSEGIVHTPPELARFVARAADDLVREQLGHAGGLAGSAVALIDPACGPGAFLAAALSVAAGRAQAPRAVLGLDCDPAAIAAAAGALRAEFARCDWPCALEARDSLRALAPAELAGLAPCAVVLGNPPWIGSAQAKSAPWLEALMEDFRRDLAGVRLPERKLGVLSDAYVRFVRVAVEIARCAARGAVIALVTNASYLDGPVHRGMRAALRREFDALYVLDLGGSALLARARGAGRDDNVFGVRPSVAVLLGVRRPERDPAQLAPVHYLRLAGPLSAKLERLAGLRLADPGFRPLQVDGAQQRFVPTAAPRGDYARWPSLAEAMPFHREGVQTNRDALVVDRDRAQLLRRLRAFAAGERSAELAPLWRALGHYDPEQARRAVAAALARDPEGVHGCAVRAIAYRPWDQRWFAPIAPLCHRPRPDLLAAIDRSQFALVTVRKDRGELPWAHFGAARAVIDNCFLSTRSSCRARAFPTHTPDGHQNLDPQFAAAFSERIGRALDAAEFAAYALAVLASPEYRREHGDALRTDYPRIPPPTSAAQFAQRCAAGQRLIALYCDTDGVAPQSDRRAQLGAWLAEIDGA